MNDITLEDLNNLNSKEVILIGQLTQEGITTKIKALGYSYRQKIFVSSMPENWLSAIELIKESREQGSLIAVICKFTEYTIFMCTEKRYQEIFQDLLEELSKCKSIIFVYEENLQGKFSDWALGRHGYMYTSYLSSRIGYDQPKRTTKEYMNEQDTQEWKKFISNVLKKSEGVVSQLLKSSVQIAPYHKNFQITLRVQEFLDEIDAGVLLRLYIPSGRYQADQLASFIHLLENYLRNVERKSFSVDLQKENHGTVYIFRSQDNFQMSNFDDAITRFEKFMQLCQNDMNSARAILSSANLSEAEIELLISKYLRDYKRLVLDIKHEYERKTLMLKQQLDTEMLESTIQSNLLVSQPETPSSLLSFHQNNGTINISLSTPSVHDNQIINTTVAQILNGDVKYGVEDRQLIELFEKYADKLEAVKLRSNLDELKDESAPQEVRQTARQKIAAFLYKVVSALGEGVVGGLIAYLEKKIAGM